MAKNTVALVNSLDKVNIESHNLVRDVAQQGAVGKFDSI